MRLTLSVWCLGPPMLAGVGEYNDTSHMFSFPTLRPSIQYFFGTLLEGSGRLSTRQ